MYNWETLVRNRKSVRTVEKLRLDKYSDQILTKDKLLDHIIFAVKGQ